MSKKRIAAGLLAAGIGIGGLVAAPAGAAVTPDGSNGQQVEVYTGSATLFAVCGDNQNGTYVCQRFTDQAYTYSYTGGWWWKGTVGIAGNNGVSFSCNVPKTYSSNIYYCGAL